MFKLSHCFAGIAKGSTGEVKCQLLLTQDLGYMVDEEYSNLVSDYERVSQMPTKLARASE